jgi:hypothetical protein
MDQTNETRLGSAPLGKLLFQLGLPGVAAQVINVLYNIETASISATFQA